MKKAKVILMAVTIITVVGSALAFKSNKAFDGSYICRTDGVQGTCPVTNDRYKITQPPQSGTNRFCNNGAGSTMCNNSLRTALDPR